MAEIAAGFAGAASTLAAVRAATSTGFAGRHESTHRWAKRNNISIVDVRIQLLTELILLMKGYLALAEPLCLLDLRF
jgi:hypothetical protein